MAEVSNHRILIVDDDPDILEMLKYNLEGEGYKVETVADSRKALDACRKFKPALIILDIMMPHQDGVETCRLIRQRKEFENTHILFLTARSEEYSEVAAFETGADDYIIKPIRPRALLSRIAKALSPSTKTSNLNGAVDAGDLKVDSDSYTVTIGGNKIDLPKKEFELLYFLCQKPRTYFFPRYIA